jgi:NIMA (never in mitosis gene a)-related kinase 1/4/5
MPFGDRFEKLRLLGKGVRGKVFLVKDRLSGQEFAAKQIRCEFQREIEDAMREAELLRSLEHPNIIRFE